MNDVRYHILVLQGLLRRYRWVIKRLQSAFNEDRKLDKVLIEELRQAAAKLQEEVKALKSEKVSFLAFFSIKSQGYPR